MTGSRPRPPASLPRDARAMLAAYRDAEDIPDDVEDRIWSVVGAEDAPAPAYDPLEAAAPAPRQRAAWIVTGLAVAAALVVVWRVGGALVERRAAEAGPSAAPMQADGTRAEGEARAGATASERRRGEARPSTAPDPGTEPTPSSPEDARAPSSPREVSSTETSEVRPRPRPNSTPQEPEAEAPAETPTSTLAAERELVARAWRALAQGDTQGALAVAAEHARRFEHGLLAPERAAVETIARCRRGEGAPADNAARFHRAHPRSPLADRVDDACGPAEKKSATP